MTGLPAYRTNKVCGMHFNLPQFFKMKNVGGPGPREERETRVST